MSCRGCGEPALHRVLDLGAVPAADHFPPASSPVRPQETAHPLAMALCPDCGLAQLSEDDTVTEEPRGIEPQALRDQAADAVARVAGRGWLTGATVREFGSPHGGSWLPLLADRGFASTSGPADVVLDCFGIMHEPDQKAAFAQRAAATRPGGVLLLQYHSLSAIVSQGQWNALRHGHFAYYSMPALVRLLAGAGMRAETVWHFDLYGGTVLVAAVHGDAPPGPDVAVLLDTDAAMTDARHVGALQAAADTHASQLRGWLETERNVGRRVYAYGAASRAVALFARGGVDRSLIGGVADASPAKQGRRMPGTDVPIISPDDLQAARPDSVLLTVPDLLPEVSARMPGLAGRWVTDERFAVPQEPSFERSRALQDRLHELVPGGAHTYARGSDQYPEFMTPVLTRGAGARVWDVDGNSYVEYGMGLRSVTLGHGYRPVVEAVSRAIAEGVNFSRPTAMELTAAEDFLSLVPGADMVKFAKNGSDVTTAAVRLARAVTGRVKVAACEQPFFSTDDWFIGTTAMNSGIPDAHVATTVRFTYNDLDSVAVALAGGDVACVILEAATATAEPAPGFLAGLRALCDRHGTLLVFDEMITGFRWSAGGAQAVYGVRPDLSCWGKAMANGFPLSALAGRREYMERGGLRTDEDRVFLLSTTHGAETASLAAFSAVVQAYRDGDPVGRMERAGRLLADGVTAAVAEHGLQRHVRVIGRPSCLVFVTGDAEGVPSQPYRTLFLQELLRRGVLGQSFVTSAAHTDDDIEHTITAVRGALPVYRRAIDAGSVDGLLEGRPVAPAIRRTAAPRFIDARVP
jgi:glutamate-1-semialdehyde aminotransferase